MYHLYLFMDFSINQIRPVEYLPWKSQRDQLPITSDIQYILKLVKSISRAGFELIMKFDMTFV